MVGFIHQSAVTHSIHLQSSYTPHLQYLQSEMHLESSRAFVGELFSRKRQRVKAVGYFCRRATLCIFDRMFDRILNATSPNNLLWLEEGLRRSFTPLELHKGILESLCLLILLIYTSNRVLDGEMLPLHSGILTKAINTVKVLN